MLVPARQVGTHRTAGPILQKEPTDGGVSGGVGHSQWWPSGGHGFGSGSRGDSVHIDSQGPASLHPVLGSSLGTDIIFEFGPNLKSPRLDARPCSAGRQASLPHCESLGTVPRLCQFPRGDFLITRRYRTRSIAHRMPFFSFAVCDSALIRYARIARAT